MTRDSPASYDDPPPRPPMRSWERKPLAHPMEFDVLLEQDEDGMWSVSVPALPGCFTEGTTREEALANAQEAIALHLEDADALPLHKVELVKVHVEA